MTAPAAAPGFFGPTQRPLFGWLHLPGTDRPRDLGVVICNPFGDEAICAHRTLRHLAEHAAVAGFPVLRFDYDGTGDSAGDDLDAHRVTAWTSSIGHAIDLIRSKGATRVVLIGVRLGAALAVNAALSRDDVHALALIAPVTGKAFLRELRALQLAMNQSNSIAADGHEGIEESAGFCLTAQTRDDLSRLDFSRAFRSPAPAILLLDRDDLPMNAKMQATLEGLGAGVDRRTFRGYVEMMLDPHKVVVPDAMIADAVDWLRQLPWRAFTLRSGTPSAPASIPIVLPDTSTTHVEESGVLLGSDQLLFGIVSRSPSVVPSGKCVLLINSGAVHHIGPNRLYTTLARRWALDGHVILRLDLRGLGDSRPHAVEPENVVYGQKAVSDLGEALQYFQEHYATCRCHAIGLCAGAYHSLKMALHHKLAGIIAINPLTFFWKDGMDLSYPEHRVADDALRYRRTAFQLSSWLKLLSGGVDIRGLLTVSLLRAKAVTKSHWRNIGRALRLPMHDDLGSELLRLARQRTQISFVFSAGDAGRELLRLQAGLVTQRLQRRGQLDLEIIEGATHTFTDRKTRVLLVETLTQLLNRHPSESV